MNRVLHILILLVFWYAMFLHFTSPEFWGTSSRDCYWDGVWTVCE